MNIKIQILRDTMLCVSSRIQTKNSQCRDAQSGRLFQFKDQNQMRFTTEDTERTEVKRSRSKAIHHEVNEGQEEKTIKDNGQALFKI